MSAGCDLLPLESSTTLAKTAWAMTLENHWNDARKTWSKTNPDRKQNETMARNRSLPIDR
jgi:hypothetical protein